MNTILVPVNSFESGVTNLKYALGVAAMSGAKVFLVNTYKEFSKVGNLTKVNQLIIEDSEQALDRVVSAVDVKDIHVQTLAIKGDPFEGITRVSEQIAADLMILSPQSVAITDKVYLGNITGKLVKQSKIPVLIVPEGYIFRKVERILLAFKNGMLSNPSVLKPLEEIAQLFSAKINLLQVVTPDVSNDDETLDPSIEALQYEYQKTENATIFQGVLEHFQSNNPDLLCVFRRNRGFFEKLWEKNTVLKKDFYTSKPLLILQGQE